MKKIILIVILLIYISIIFIFSHQAGSTSTELSDSVIVFVGGNTDNLDLSFLIRKSAHFLVYFGLGILSYLTFLEFRIKRVVLISFVFCSLYAISDEVHQLLIPGRSGQISDVLLDSIGASIGILIVNYLVNKVLID